jgi:hypothetical protein
LVRVSSVLGVSVFASAGEGSAWHQRVTFVREVSARRSR